MITVQDAINRLKILGVDNAKVTVRGSGTFFVVIDLGTDDHLLAYKSATPIWKLLYKEGLTSIGLDAHVGDHGDGYQTLHMIINLNPPEPPKQVIIYCPQCQAPLIHYLSGWIQCPKCEFSVKVTQNE